jgi:hypothetical protein
MGISPLPLLDAPTSLDGGPDPFHPMTGTMRGYSNVAYNTQISYFGAFTGFCNSSTQFPYLNSYSFALMFVPQGQSKPRNRRQTGGNYYLAQGQAVTSAQVLSFAH